MKTLVVLFSLLLVVSAFAEMLTPEQVVINSIMETCKVGGDGFNSWKEGIRRDFGLELRELRPKITIKEKVSVGVEGYIGLLTEIELKGICTDGCVISNAVIGFIVEIATGRIVDAQVISATPPERLTIINQ